MKRPAALLIAALLAGCGPAPVAPTPVAPAATGDAPAAQPAAPQPGGSAPGDVPAVSPPSTPTNPAPAAPAAPGGSSGSNAAPPGPGQVALTVNDHPSGTWLAGANLRRGRFGHGAVVIDGILTVIDGEPRGSFETLVDSEWTLVPVNVAGGTLPIAAVELGGVGALVLTEDDLRFVNTDLTVEPPMKIYNNTFTLTLGRKAAAIGGLITDDEEAFLFVAGGLLGRDTVPGVTRVVPLDVVYEHNFKEVYQSEEVTDSSGAAVSMPVAVAGAGFTPLDGHMVLVGGYTMVNGQPVAQAASQAFDLTTRTWTTAMVPALPAPRHSGALAELNGALYFAGGRDSQGAVADEVWRWAPGETAWTLVGRLPTPRAMLSLTPLEGQLYAIGGMDAEGRASTLVEVFQP